MTAEPPEEEPTTEEQPADLFPGPGSSWSALWSDDEIFALQEIETAEPGLDRTKDYPVSRQFCGNPDCRKPVGRAIGSQPPIRQGFCPYCGTPFSFLPKLARGDVVAGRYEVDGRLAHGGLGWIYLARDRRLQGMPVVLKGIINATDGRALRLAHVERDALIRLDHPNIVRIISYVEHPDPHSGRTDEYIVMEFVRGHTLQAVLDTGAPELRLEDVTAYGHWILAALQYLHGEQLLYCDLKPENVMHGGNRLKIIDLGATRGIGETGGSIIGTDGFRVDRDEIRRHGLTERSDVHTVGRTLEKLFDAARAREADPRVAFGVESLRRLLNRAVASFESRFASAAEMAEQLDGVHRELLSLRRGKPYGMASTRFENTAELLDAGLGVVPGLDRWTAEETPDGTIHDGLPPPKLAASRLPVPRVAESDPAAAHLANARVLAEPRKLLSRYEDFGDRSVELDLALARVHIELDGLVAAAYRVTKAAEQLGEWAAHDWRITWHYGLLGLAKGNIGEAFKAFDSVYSQVPGEAAPKLALGFCFEHLEDDEQARRHYEVVWRRDNEQASAAFGLARVALRQGDRDAAVHILDRVPRSSRHYDAARIGAVRVLLARFDGALPGMHDIATAAERLPDLYLDNGEPDGEARQRLVAILRETALARVLASGPGAGADRSGGLLGEHVAEPELRVLLERSYHELARHARDRQEHGVLIDAANTVRPWTKR
ncbi:protein kinase [Amycolatopsis acidicola]|uniref:non-specific serine/threonine protein kinase n=1 Tax=Amycolatopsis acidicola TaxID=2596893 RepID=A0A5N0V643_9PSEU|nr:serine/threonine-protein kinase [Amycolatopsis acidicola]KAA9160908.1 protein kinase [Amycolatopsis acidicola]